jgi:imidazolonepropionase-like amidohydrolase
MHINMAGRGGGQGYPNSLLGSIAFTRQGLLDAQWQREALSNYEKAGGRGPRPLIEPPLTALQAVLARQLPAAFDAMEGREIDRALAMAAEFELDPIIVGAQMADQRAAELAKAKARVIFSLAFPGSGRGAGGGGGGGGGGRGGGGGTPSLRELREQAAMPKAPAALAQAGVPFAFTSGSASPADFVRNAGRVIKDGGLSAEAALRALTIDAARIAGAADRLGTIETGKIANLIVMQGDLFDGGSIRHVVIDGQQVDLELPAAAGRGRGGN